MFILSNVITPLFLIISSLIMKFSKDETRFSGLIKYRRYWIFPFIVGALKLFMGLFRIYYYFIASK
jgi:hypothetical protein